MNKSLPIILFFLFLLYGLTVNANTIEVCPNCEINNMGFLPCLSDNFPHMGAAKKENKPFTAIISPASRGFKLNSNAILGYTVINNENPIISIKTEIQRGAKFRYLNNLC